MFGRKPRPQADFSCELDAHLALEVDRLCEEGLSEEAAWRQAKRNLGNMGTAGERFYEAGRWMWLEQLIQDTRHVLRRLRKSPVFAATAILTVALGIGATTSIFTLVYGVLLKSLAVSKPGELYRLGKRTHCCVWGGFSQDKEFSIVSYDLYKHFRDNIHGFAELAAFSAGQPLFGVRRANSSEPAASYPGEYVSGNYFVMFGVNAYTGRMLSPSDDMPGVTPAAVMSYHLWHEKYGLDPGVVGGIFNINGVPFTVVGVTPPSFYGDALRGTQPDFFLPLQTEPMVARDSSLLRGVSTHWLDLIGRIRPGANAATVEAQMHVLLQQWLRSHWPEMGANARELLPQQTLYLSPGGAGITMMREQYEKWLQVLMMVTGFVLLIVCANVANLMLVRGMERRPQTSLSMALGARPSRLVRQALTESLVISLIGGAAGVGLAFAGTSLILDSVFQKIAGFAGVPIDASPSLPVLGFTFAVSLLTGALFGVAPAWMATRVDPIEALRGAHRTTRRAGSLPRKAMVVLQASLALVLLSASGLLTAALRNLENQDFGFDQDRRIVANVDPALAAYGADQLSGLYRRLLDSVNAIPGVESTSMCSYSPQSGDSWNDGIFVDGRPAPGPRDDNGASWDRVSAVFFETIGNPIVKGRPITVQDTATSLHIAVINEAFARKFFKNEDPIGKHFGRSVTGSRDFEIVGVAKDARILTYNLDQPVRPFFFVPEPQLTTFADAAEAAGEVRSHFLHDIVIFTKPGVTLPDAAVRRAIGRVDPNLPIQFVRSMRDQVAGNFGQQRLIARLTSLFGILALILASIGIYGVTAYHAGSRTSEIGVRIALGANRRHILALVLGGSLLLIATGLFLGAPLIYATGRVMSSQLYGMSPYNPTVIAAAVGMLGLSAFVAALIPALRASAISPVKALRAE